MAMFSPITVSPLRYFATWRGSAGGCIKVHPTELCQRWLDLEYKMFNDIVFEDMAKLSPDELLAFYQRQNHATTQSREKLQKMLDNTFCVVTARRNGDLIGFARGVTDGLSGRLAECKLDPTYQGPACVTRTDGRIEHDSEGIAAEMALRVIEALRNFGVERIDAVAHGTEIDFCEELGFKKQRGVVALELPLSASRGQRSAAAASANA